MKTVYLTKSLTYKTGLVLKVNTPYKATWNDENSLWNIQYNNLVKVNVSPKYIYYVAKID